jgi:hypothetical protein
VATQALFFFLEEGRKRSIALGNGFHVATFTYFDACNEHAQIGSAENATLRPSTKAELIA